MAEFIDFVVEDDLFCFLRYDLSDVFKMWLLWITDLGLYDKNI